MLRASELTFAYEGAAPIIQDWSMEVSAGEVVAITGPSGRGKSTLLYVLGLMLTPTSGQITVQGLPASSLSDADRAHLRARLFGFVFQDAVLDPTRTVLDNVLETTLYRGGSRRADALRARRLLGELGVEVRASATPGQVSGGQAQRIALCRALVGDPAIVLADEPTGNLDRVSAESVLGALRAQARRGAAVLIVTHDDSVVAECDRRIDL